MLAAVRVRGKPDLPAGTEETLSQLGMDRKHRCVVVPDTETFRGMLTAVKDSVTFGTPSDEFVAELFEEQDAIDDIEELGFESAEAVVEALDSGDMTLSEAKADGLTNVFNLRPPRKGFANTKQHYRQNGSLGDRGEDIEELLRRMR